MCTLDCGHFCHGLVSQGSYASAIIAVLGLILFRLCRAGRQQKEHIMSFHAQHSTLDNQHISCSREPFCGSQTICSFPFLVHCLVSTVVNAKCDVVLLWLNPGGSGKRGCCLTCWSFREQLLRLTPHRFDTLVSVMLQSIL